MEHAVFVAHPLEHSFTMSVANAYCEAIRAAGQRAKLHDLYRMNFAPTLAADEIPRPGGFAPGADVLEKRRQLSGMAIFVYPFWMNAEPAMMKGYIDRVFGMDFAYGSAGGGNVPLLNGRKMISFTSSGAPSGWFAESGAWNAARTLFDEHFAAVCDLEILHHVHFGGIVPGIRADTVERHLERVRATVAKHFAGQRHSPPSTTMN